jgi:hypothetical protein
MATTAAMLIRRGWAWEALAYEIARLRHDPTADRFLRNNAEACTPEMQTASLSRTANPS